MGSVKDKLKNYGYDMDSKTFDSSKFVPTEQELYQENYNYWKKECERLNSLYWQKYKPLVDGVENPSEADKQRSIKIYQELETARAKLQALADGQLGMNL